MNLERFTNQNRLQSGLALLLLTTLVGCSTGQGQTLNDRLRAMKDGSAAEIVLIPARTKDGTTSQTQAPPPSGRSMRSVKDLKAPDLGIPLPSTKSASQPDANK